MTTGASEQPALVGEWGGFQTMLKLHDGGGTIDFECGRAVIGSGIHPDANGDFRATAKFEAYTPGPNRNPDQAPAFTPATVSGHVDAKTIRLTMTLADASPPQTMTLTRDRKARIIRCS